MVAGIWEAHKKFIIGLVVGLLFLLVTYQIAVAPLGRKAQKIEKRSKEDKKKLDRLFAPGAPEHPTSAMKSEYGKAASQLQSELDDAKSMVSFPVQAPFVLPAGETMASAYYMDVFSQVKREIQVAANTRAIEINRGVLSGRGAVERDKVGQALVSLAVMRRALLTAIASGVTSLESVTFNTGTRSAPIEGYRLDENLISVTVRGSAETIQNWLKNLGRRGSFLMIASASLKAPEGDDSSGNVTAQVEMGPVVVSEAAPEEDEEEE